MNRKHLLIGAGVSILAVLLAGVVLFAVNWFRSKQLSQADILYKIVQNNSRIALTNKGGQLAARAESNMSTAGQTAPVADIMMPAPVARDFSYIQTRTQVTTGPALKNCSTFGYYVAGTTNYFDYYDSKQTQPQSASKTIIQDDNGVLIDYSLVMTDGSSIYYKGGSYAVKIKNNVVPVLAPKTETTSPDAGTNSSTTVTKPSSATTNSTSVNTSSPQTDTITSYFGPDATVKGTVTENGKNYYEVVWSYQSSCSLDTTIIQPLRKDSTGSVSTTTNMPQVTIMTRALVDQQTFAIAKQQEYLNTIDAANLIAETTTDVQQQNVSYQSVASVFTFEYQVPIKDIVYPAYSLATQLDNINKYLQSATFNLIRPDDSSFTLQSISSSEADKLGDQPLNYLADRSFYPNNLAGDAMYQQATAYLRSDPDSFPTPLIQYSFANNPTPEQVRQGVIVAVYKLSEDESKVVQSNTGVTSKPVSVTITINGQKIVANNYTYSMNSGVSSSGSGSSGQTVPPASPVAAPEPADITGAVMTFPYQGYRFVLVFSPFNSQQALIFKTIDKTQVQALLEQLKENNLNPSGKTPVDLPATQ